MISDHDACVALNLVPDMGTVTFRKLEAVLGSASAVATATMDDLLQCPGIGMAKATAFAEALASIDPGMEEARAAKKGIRIIAICDPEYPKILKGIYDPPLALYCYGDLEAFSRPGVAMVGTRTPSLYGMETAKRFAHAIASAGFCIVSGMARGIDTASHQGALDARGRTIAVLGGAIDCFYPTENKELGRTVAKSGGLIISEFPLGRKPDRLTFPRRNRIVSGLSRITLVVEAAAKSGSLITASQAVEQNRPVMAIPGRIDVPTSLGCNLLIRDGATMALSPDDVLDELYSLPLAQVDGPDAEEKDSGDGAASAGQPATKGRGRPPRACAAPAPQAFVPLSDEEQRLLDAIGGEETMIDEVIRVSNVEAGRANALLMALQLKRLAEILPGGWVRRKNG